MEHSCVIKELIEVLVEKFEGEQWSLQWIAAVRMADFCFFFV